MESTCRMSPVTRRNAMNQTNETRIEFSQRRPENLAWRVESEGHVTYGKTRELALELHRQKLEMCGQIENILARCAKTTLA